MRRRKILVAWSFGLTLLGCTPPPQTFGAAPSFALRDLGGGTVSLEGLRGKVVVLDFWATWCSPCIAEIPDYSELWRKNQGRGVEVIGVVFDSGEPKEIQDFVRERRMTYRQLIGDEKLLAAYEANEGFPTTFVIDRKGTIVSKTVGSRPDKFDRLQQAIDNALGPS